MRDSGLETCKVPETRSDKSVNMPGRLDDDLLSRLVDDYDSKCLSVRSSVSI